MDFYSLADLIERVDAVKERKQMVLDKLFMINIPLEAQCKLADRLNEYAKAEEARAIGELVACLGPEAYSSESSESEQDYDSPAPFSAEGQSQGDDGLSDASHSQHYASLHDSDQQILHDHDGNSLSESPHSQYSAAHQSFDCGADNDGDYDLPGSPHYRRSSALKRHQSDPDNESCQSPTAVPSAPAVITPSPAAHTPASGGQPFTPGGTADGGVGCKRQRVAVDHFSPAKEYRMKDSNEYKYNERERQERRAPEGYVEAAKKLKAFKWTNPPGVGDYLEQEWGVWVAPDVHYSVKSVMGKDFFTDPIKAVQANQELPDFKA